MKLCLLFSYTILYDFAPMNQAEPDLLFLEEFKKKGGISILARNLILTECDEDAKLCNFLKVQRFFANEKNKAPIDIIDYHGR